MDILNVFLGFGAMILPNIISGIICYKRAEKLNRNQVGWGAFGLLVPILSLIIVFMVSPKSKFNRL